MQRETTVPPAETTALSTDTSAPTTDQMVEVARDVHSIVAEVQR